ncbi:uncharacterized protein LOC116342572 [Contarinia nasturtii]|uniref:uncharacterized protein LOC116342572 n=1 Tax=Contarinia nasturtii TaxID=265458 RepID=UPI0012D426BB|nr:uncharacterized protein LOC116342572 [Contarinia nasturtii]
MEKIKKFNLELALFVKELKSYINDVSVVNDETTHFLMETIIAVDKLQATSRHCEKSASNENRFVQDLNEDIFECRRHIVCRVCHEHIPLSAEDFEIHIQKKGHKEKEAKQSSLVPEIRERSTSSELNPSSSELNPSSSVSSVNSIDVNAAATVNGEVTKSNTSVLSVKLENIVKTDAMSEKIVNEILELTSRNEVRLQNETKIIDSLTHYLGAFDSTLKFIPFGSSTFGFGGSKTNFNILVNASGFEKSPAIALHEFEKMMKTCSAQNDFEILENISGNRVQRKRLQFLHKQSRILCWLQFSSNFELAKSNQVIRDYIRRDPACYYLIAYIRSWQNILNDIAAKENTTAFHFNTYIISVLVIFFLQMNNQFPKVKELPTLESKCIVVVPKPDQGRLKQVVFGFFEFYAKRYEIKNHLISINIGRWQERHLQSHQINFTSEQKSLRDAMESNGANWKDCTMYVQDIDSQGMNITAEISNKEAHNFKKMCQMFFTDHSQKKFIDEYVSKVSTLQKSSDKALTANKIDVSPLISMNTLKTAIKSVAENLATGGNINPFSSKKSEKLPRAVSKEQINLIEGLEKRIDFSKTYETIIRILDKAGKLTVEKYLRINRRKYFELDIISTLDHYLKLFNPTFEPIHFGSSKYGLKDFESNLHLFVFIDDAAPAEIIRKFEDYLGKSNIQNHFKEISKINGYRVLKPQISMIHIDSGIRCFLLFDNDKTIPDSSEIIQRFIEKLPLCESLIRFIRAWQMVLKDMYPNSDIIQFQFNTYIISILVIFFFQMNFNAPSIENIWSHPPLAPPSNGGDIKAIACKFFAFYGNNYQIWNHVISTQIGRWQERRLQPEQKNFTQLQKRLRDGIESNPASWTNCTMYIQDLVRSDVNIAAEIPKKAAENFQQLCQIFAKYFSRIYRK